MIKVNFTSHNVSHSLLPENESNLKSKFKCEMLDEFTNYSLILNFDCNFNDSIILNTTTSIYILFENEFIFVYLLNHINKRKT